MLGRPIIFDAEKQAKLCGMLAMGCSRAAAARYIGIAPSTIYRLMDANAEFREQVRQSEADAEMIPLQEIRKAMAKSWRAAAWYLQRFDPGRWGRDAKPPRETAYEDKFDFELWDEAAREMDVEVPGMPKKRDRKPSRKAGKNAAKRSIAAHSNGQMTHGRNGVLTVEKAREFVAQQMANELGGLRPNLSPEPPPEAVLALRREAATLIKRRLNEGTRAAVGKNFEKNGAAAK